MPVFWCYRCSRRYDDTVSPSLRPTVSGPPIALECSLSLSLSPSASAPPPSLHILLVHTHTHARMQVKFEPGAPLFSVHVELLTADGNTRRVSVGNIFKQENLKAGFESIKH